MTSAVRRRAATGVAALAVSVAGLAGCGDDTAPAPTRPTTAPSAPTGSAPAWVEPPAYGFVLEQSCGERSLIGRFRVTVVDGQVTRVQSADQGTELDLRSYESELVPSLGQLLAAAQTAREDGAEVVRTDVDPVDGHPTSVQIDPAKDAVDDESCYAVSEYTIGVTPTASR